MVMIRPYFNVYGFYTISFNGKDYLKLTNKIIFVLN